MEIAHLIMNDLQVDKINRESMSLALDLALSDKVDNVTKVTPGHEIMAKWKSPRIMLSHLLEEFAPDQIKKRSKVHHIMMKTNIPCTERLWLKLWIEVAGIALFSEGRSPEDYSAISVAEESIISLVA